MWHVYRIFEQDDSIELTDIEREHITDANNTDNMIKTANVLYQTKKFEKFTKDLVNSNKQVTDMISLSTDKIIESNTKLSQSNEKYQKAMNWLTFWLVLVWIIQIFLSFKS